MDRNEALPAGGSPSTTARRRRVVILGAAGRDFHNFNVVFRDDPSVEVMAFTATQIPGIGGRRYPPSLAGDLYPGGIPIIAEAELEDFCRQRQVDEIVFAYSDVTHAEVMHLASRALALGADFRLLGPRSTMLSAQVPVIAVSAVRTGCGKSQTARRIVRLLRRRGLRCVALRHPMPYGQLERQRVQRFATPADLDGADCTNEEREEYEPYVGVGAVVYAGVDYAAIMAAAEAEADVIVWDGGNNDFPFFRPDLHCVVLDALRPDQVDTHHPGEAVARMADVFIVNKTDAAPPESVRLVCERAKKVRPEAAIVLARSPVRLAEAGLVRGRRVVVVDDGPTLTHGGVAYGAGLVAALAAGAGEIVDPRPHAAPRLRQVYEAHPHLGKVLPAVGYDAEQLEDLRRTIEDAAADVVVSGTPCDLAARLHTHVPIVRAFYELEDAGEPTLPQVVDAFLAARGWDVTSVA